MTHVSPHVEPVYGVFGHRLRSARQLAGLTIVALAHKVGRTPSSLSNIEQGQQRIPLHLAIELADAVGASMGALTRPSGKRARWEALGE